MKYYYKKNRLILFWYVGKYVYRYHKSNFKNYATMSNILRYYFGMTELFSIENIKFMELFYLRFPIYTDLLENLNWDFYKKLILIEDSYYRMIYYKLAVFSKCDYLEFENAIINRVVERI